MIILFTYSAHVRPVSMQDKILYNNGPYVSLFIEHYSAVRQSKKSIYFTNVFFTRTDFRKYGMKIQHVRMDRTIN